MSSNLEGETVAADPGSDPGGDEMRTADSAVKSSQEVEMKDSSETTVEVPASEGKATGDVQGGAELEGTKEEDSSFVEGKRADPTEISLNDLTGGLDMEGQPAGGELEEGEMEASVEKEAGSDREQEVKSSTETDPVEVSEAVGEVKESKSTGEEVLEGVQEKEITEEELEQKNEEAGEIEDGQDQVVDAKSTGDVQQQEVLEGSVEEKEAAEEELEKEVVPVEEKKEEATEAQPVSDTEKVLEETAEAPAVTSEKVLEEMAEAPAVASEKVLEKTAPAVTSEKVLEETAPAVTSEKVLEETAPAVASEKVLEETVELPAVNSEKGLEEAAVAPAVATQVESNVSMEVDLNCGNNAEIEGQSERIWGAELAGEDSRNELTVNDFIMVEAKEAGESEAGPTFAEIQTDGEGTVEQNNTKTSETKEAVVYHRREKHTPKSSPTGPDSSVTQTQTSSEEEIPVKYDLPSLDKGTFVIYDLVWGKVKSHPWWPGLIISPSDASSLATKYQKRDAFLVAYFGDKTFAWCEASQLKPFFENFSHFEKQASSDAFNNAVKSVLSEVSRRFEVGSICSCLDEKLLSKEVYPKIENAGVKQGFDNCEVSRGEIVNYFNSEGIVGFVKNLALEPFKGTDDKLGLNMVTSLIKSFYRKKGYLISSKYQTFGPLEDYIEPTKTEKLLENNTISDEINTNPVNTLSSNPNTDSIYAPVIFPNKNINQNKDVIIDPPPKRKRGRPPKKKKEETDLLDSQKPLSDLVHKKPASNLSNGSKPTNNKPDKPALVSWDDDSAAAAAASLPWKKQKPIVDFDFVDQESKTLTHSSGFGFKIGACISRAASRLTGSGSGSQPVMTMPKFDSTDFDVSSDDELASPKESSYSYPEGKKVRKRRLKKYHYSDPHEILSQLCFLATSPLKEYVFINTVVSYFTDFRKFIVPAPEQEPDSSVPVSETGTVPEKVKLKRGRKRKVDLAQVQMDQGIDNNNQLQDSYWSDMILSSQTEESNVWPKVYKRRASLESKNLTGPDSKRALVLLAASNRPVIRVEEKRLGECNPTALLLNFSTRYGPVPAETDLVRIFSRYGALKGDEMEREMEGKVSKVKVVFKRRADADVAFGSLRKENVFGPALISYRLVYLSEMERKSPVPNGEHHSNLDIMPGLTSGDRGDDVSEMMDQSSTVHQMISEMSSEIPTDQTIMMQRENLDEPTVQPEAQTVAAEISSEPSNLVQDENRGGENQMDEATRDDMEIYDSSHVQAGDEMQDDSLKTVQEQVVGPLDGSSMQPGIENEETNNNPSENVQGEIGNVKKETEIIQGEIESEQQNDPAGAEVDDVAEMQIDQPNTEEQGGITGDEQGEIAEDEGLNDDNKAERGEIFGDEEEEELSGETEHREISGNDEQEQGEIVTDEAEQGEIVGEEEG